MTARHARRTRLPIVGLLAVLVIGVGAVAWATTRDYEGRPIFYGLGNFVWPNPSVEGSTTAVAQVVVTPDGRIRGRLLPAFIESPGHPVLRATNQG